MRIGGGGEEAGAKIGEERRCVDWGGAEGKGAGGAGGKEEWGSGGDWLGLIDFYRVNEISDPDEKHSLPQTYGPARSWAHMSSTHLPKREVKKAETNPTTASRCGGENLANLPHRTIQVDREGQMLSGGGYARSLYNRNGMLHCAN